jgi:zinc protease
MLKYKNILKTFLAVLIFSNAAAYSGDGTKEFEVDGLRVIIKDTGKDVISARLFITGGTANYPLERQGIEELAYSIVMKGGTLNYPKDEFLSISETIGTRFGSDGQLDYGEMNMLCLKESWDKSWDLFTDAVLNPAFLSSEFTNKQQQLITAAKQTEADPDGKLEELILTTAFKGKNYEKKPNGTAESLANLTLDDIKSFYASNVCKKRAFLVIAGSVDENDIREKVKATLSKLPEGTPSVGEEVTKIEQPAQDIVDRKISTNYLAGIMSGIPWNSPDAVAMMVAMNIMYDRYFIELRSKRGLSYAPAAYMNGSAITNPYSVFYITTDHPKDAIQVMVDIINDVRKNGFTEEELKGSKDSYITTHFMRLETASNQSLNIGRWELRGNIKAFDEFEKMVNAVSIQDVNRVFTSNTGTIKWTYLGDQTKVTPEDFKQIEKIGF